jgi:hypothetical protein
MVFVLGLAVSAFAIHAEIPAETQAVVAKGTTQITLGGSLRFRGDMRDNTSDFNDDNADYQSSYDGRVRLWLNANVSENTMGRVQLESTDCTTANNDSADTYTWGSCGSDAEGTYGSGNGKRGDLRILEAWIQTKNVLGTPISLKVGHMPLKLGNGLFFDHSKFGDDAIMLFMNPTDQTHVALINAKFTEGNIASAAATQGQDDADAYVLLGSFDGGAFNVSGDITYLNDQSLSTEGLHLWNIGIRGNATVADMVNVKADVELQTGKLKNTPATDTKYRGYAFLIAADVNLDMVTLDAAIGYGSGDDNASDNKIKTFQTAQSSTQKYTFVYDYRVATAGVNAPSAGASPLGATDTGIANTTYYKIGASASPVADLSAKLDIYLLPILIAKISAGKLMERLSINSTGTSCTLLKVVTSLQAISIRT